MDRKPCAKAGIVFFSGLFCFSLSYKCLANSGPVSHQYQLNYAEMIEIEVLVIGMKIPHTSEVVGKNAERTKPNLILGSMTTSFNMFR